MADSPAFELVCREIEENSSLDRLEARGTVRLALKDAGLAAATVSPQHMEIVVERLLPAALEARGIDRADALCARLRSCLRNAADASRAATPDAIFERLKD